MGVYTAFGYGRWHSGVRGVSACVLGTGVLLRWGSLELGRGTFALWGIRVSAVVSGFEAVVFWRSSIWAWAVVLSSGMRELVGVGPWCSCVAQGLCAFAVHGTASYERVGAAHRPSIPAVRWSWPHSSFVLARSTVRRRCVGQLGVTTRFERGVGGER